MPERLRPGAAPGSDEALEALRSFTSALVEGVAGVAPIVKLQSAFYECHGPGGVEALARGARAAREAGLLAIVDCKRGDIGSTAKAYASTYLGPDAPVECDAITLSPYLGLDSLIPFLDACDAHGAGVFILTHTSNEGSRDLQELTPDGTPIYARVADMLAPEARRLTGATYSSLGVVVGGTFPDSASRIREALPGSWFLVPGFGAQGADETRASAFQRTGGGGALFAASRMLYQDGAGAGSWTEFSRTVREATVRFNDRLDSALAEAD